MSDKVNIITVILEKPFRDDDCAPIVSAIKMIRGVLDAEINVASPNDYWAESKAKHALGEKLMKVVYGDS